MSPDFPQNLYELQLRITKLESENSALKRTIEEYQLREKGFQFPAVTDEYSFYDLFDIDEIQALQDSFASVTGVASIITHPDGKPITNPSNFCRLCIDIIRPTDKGLANCMLSDCVIGAFKPDGPTIQRCCSCGLWDAGASIRAGDKHIANWLIGQIRNDEVDEQAMIDYAMEIGADLPGFKLALAEVPVMPLEQFREIAQSLYLFANMLSKLALQNLCQRRSISELSGMLPICSSCKKIRDDKGYWNQIENYIQSRSSALITHGICPDCMEKLYGDQKWFKKRKQLNSNKKT